MPFTRKAAQLPGEFLDRDFSIPLPVTETFARIARLTAAMFDDAQVVIAARCDGELDVVASAPAQDLDSERASLLEEALFGLDLSTSSTGCLNLTRGALAPGCLGFSTICEDGDALGVIGLYQSRGSDCWSRADLARLADFTHLIADEVRLLEIAAVNSRVRGVLETIFDYHPDAIAFADSERRFVRVNRAFSNLFGYSEEECRGRETRFIYACEKAFGQTGKERFNTQAPIRSDAYLVEYRRKDGSTFIGETMGVPVRILGTENLGFLGVIHDLTEDIAREEERARVLSELARSQKLLTDTERIGRVGSAEFDFRSGQTYRSEGLREIYGLKPGQEMSFEDALTMAAPEDVAHLKEAMASGHPFEMELPFRNQEDELVWVRLSAAPVFEQGAMVRLRVHAQDITSQKLAEESTREFISLVSHELRTPLTSILASLELLQDGVGVEFSEDGTRLMDTAYRNCNRLAGLVNDILDVNKMEAGKLKFNMLSVDACTVIDEVLSLHQPLAAHHEVELTSCIDPSQCTLIFADPDRLSQVLTNLVANAIKVSTPGQRVELGLSPVDEDWVRLCVIDQGPGIPEDFQKQIFEKFSQAPSTQPGGTGLGLAIVKGLTERMGGRVSFESSEQGTKMFVDLRRPPRS